LWRQLKKRNMKVVTIALLMFTLSVVVVMVDGLGLYNFVPAQSDNWIGDILSIEQDVFSPDQAADVATSFGFGDFVTGLLNFVKITFRATLIGEQLKLFGVDSLIANMFTLIGLIIYGIGVAQFVANRSLKGMT